MPVTGTCPLHQTMLTCTSSIGPVRGDPRLQSERASLRLLLLLLTSANGFSPRGFRQQLWRAMERLYDSGRCRAIGVSNFQISHLNDVLPRHGAGAAVRDHRS